MSGLDIFRFEVSETKDNDKLQLVGGSGFPGETFKDHHRVGFHGLASHAPKGAHAIALSAHGRRDRAVVLGLEHEEKRVRNVPEGASALYDANGNIIKMWMTGVEAEFGSRPFTIKCGVLTIEASEIVMKAGGMVARVRPARIDLGAMDAPHRVATDAGLSSKVFAVI